MYACNMFKISNNIIYVYNFEFKPFHEMARANFQPFHEMAEIF